MKKKYPKYEQIKDYVIKGIKARNFTDAVPSENQLAETFSVSRMTARKAIIDVLVPLPSNRISPEDVNVMFMEIG